MSPSILAPADVIVGEADGHVDLTVRLSSQSASTVAVHYTTADRSAVAGTACNSDYVAASGTLNFAPFETSKTVQVQILDCPNAEGFESFGFNLGSPVNGVIARASSRVSIVDNDTVVATPKLFVRDAVVDEKDGFAVVAVLLGGTGGESSSSTVTVDYATADGSAAAGSDYSAKSGTLSFAPGQTVKTVLVPIVDDTVREWPESFLLSLSNPVGATIARGDGTVTIGASDATPVPQPGIFAPFDVGVGEGDGFVDLVVHLGAPSAGQVSVNYTTQGVTAVAGTACNSDYVGTSGTLNFLAGETTKVVRVDVLDCPNVEPAETFDFVLSGAVNGVLADSSTLVTIGDNDGAQTLNSIQVTPANPLLDPGADQQFTAIGTYSDGSTQDLTGSVLWATSTGSVATISTGGLAHGITGGFTTISATQSGVTGSTNLAVSGPIAQTISFAALVGKTYGNPDFSVSASASSGLAVRFAASGGCTVNGATVHLIAAGNCTITASQPGDASYAAAPSVARTFAIAKAVQTIAFAAIPDKRVGDPDFAVGASASSGLPVGFAAAGSCTVTPSAASQATVHLTGAGGCTITASQPGNANVGAATPVAHTFSVFSAPPPPRTCKVPKLIGRRLAKAKTLIVQRRCRVGKVVFGAPRHGAARRWFVIRQSRRPGLVVRAGTKIGLVVRSRKR